MLVIGHTPDVTEVADYIVDMGPDGGKAGGEILCAGFPEESSRQKTYTAELLKEIISDTKGEQVSGDPAIEPEIALDCRNLDAAD